LRQQPVTRPQVSGYRFHLRRLENAVVRRDVRGLNDPLRSHSRALVVGVVLAAVVLAGSALFGLIRPRSHLGSEPIVMTKDSGAMFVRIQGTMHPVLNLASARLIAGQPAKPVMVSQKALEDLPRGPLVGIPGAPSAMPYDAKSAGRPLTVCDTSEGGRLQNTTLLAGLPEDLGQTRELRSDEALLLRSGERTYLVYAGKRALVDTENGAVAHALSVDGKSARQVSAALLAAIPETTEIASPTIPDAGEPGPGSLREYEVGTVVQVGQGTGARTYVVLRSGVQQISPFTGELIRFTDSHGQASIPVVPPDALPDFVNDLEVANYPETAPSIVDHATECLTWEPVARDSSGGATTRVLIGPGLPGTPKPVELVQADGSGPNLDAVYLPAGTGVFAKAVQAPSSGEHGDSLRYLSDTGVRYGVDEAKTAAMLGLEDPEPVPWQIMSLLATGPD
jgi:type VII secretion protein EccB